MHSYFQQPQRTTTSWLPSMTLVALMCHAALVASERPGILAPDEDALSIGGGKDGQSDDDGGVDTEAETDDLFGDGFVGKSIRITDPGPYTTIKKNDLGYVIRAVDAPKPTEEKKTGVAAHRPTYRERNFQLNVHDYAGPVILTGAHFEITENGAVGEELVDKFIRLLRRPVRKKLQDAGIKQKMLGQIESFEGVQDIGGFQEAAYSVQMLREPYMKPMGKPLLLHRHEFEVVPRPEHPPEHIAAPANLYVVGTEVRVHNPHGDPSRRMMLQDQHGVVKGFSTVTGMYLVYLSLYARNADLFPEEIQLWSEKQVKPVVLHDGKRKDCNYTNMQKVMMAQLGRLDTIKREITSDPNRLWGHVQAATEKHNAYVNKIWENQLVLDKFNDNVGKFQTRAAQTDEKANAEMEQMTLRGDREVEDGMALSHHFRELFGQRYEGIRASSSKIIHEPFQRGH